MLVELGYPLLVYASGELDDATAVAVLELQKWTGLPRDGVLDAETIRGLEARDPAAAGHAHAGTPSRSCSTAS